MVHLRHLNLHDEELDTISEIQPPAIRSYTRKERIHGLANTGSDPIALTPSESKVNGEYFSSYKVHDDYSRNENIRNQSQPTKRINSRRSLVSLFTKSSESQIHKSPARPSSASQSNLASESNHTLRSFRSPSPSPAPHHHRLSLASKSSRTWRAGDPFTSTTDMISEEPSAEDISTYHANLARFKAERAERAAELGIAKLNMLDPHSSSSHDHIVDRSAIPPKSERPESRGQQDGRRSSGLSLGLGRGLRAYWGGGERSGGSDVKRTEVVDRPGSRDPDLGFDGAMDRQALREWWDKLGNEMEACR